MLNRRSWIKCMKNSMTSMALMVATIKAINKLSQPKSMGPREIHTVMTVNTKSAPNVAKRERGLETWACSCVPWACS